MIAEPPNDFLRCNCPEFISDHLPSCGTQAHTSGLAGPCRDGGNHAPRPSQNAVTGTKYWTCTRCYGTSEPRLDSIRAAVAAMRNRLESGQATSAHAFARLSLEMSEDLLAMIDAMIP